MMGSPDTPSPPARLHHRPALVALVAALVLAGELQHRVRAQQWEAVPVSADPPLPLVWEPVPAGELIELPQVAQDGATPTTPAAPDTPVPWVTGGLYQIKRGDVGLPSISQRVPSGYGNRFGGFQAGLFLESCNVTGNYVCGTNDFSDEFNNYAKGAVDLVLGVGDPVKLIGIDLGFNFTSLATTRPGQDNEGTQFGEGQGLNLALSRNLGRDVSLKVGAINLVELDDTQKDTGRSAYAVVSARIDLGGPQDQNTNDLYLTAGLANGLYRPLDQIVEDQQQACDALRRSTGSNKLTPQQISDCNADGLNYGSPAPVVSLAYLINPQISLIAEWWGRNLTLAASFKPFEDINWVITPGFTNIVRNADWDPSVPGYTDRYRLQLTTSIGF